MRLYVDKKKWDYGGELCGGLLTHSYIVGDPKNLKIRENIGSMWCQSLVPEIESFRINGVQWIMILWGRWVESGWSLDTRSLSLSSSSSLSLTSSLSLDIILRRWVKLGWSLDIRAARYPLDSIFCPQPEYFIKETLPIRPIKILREISYSSTNTKKTCSHIYL